MADKVMFKLGKQENVPLSSGAANGTFYLTSDTHRLYIGQGGKAVPINAGVTFYATLAELTTATANETDEQNLAGRMFFLTTDNILCVRSNGTWVQINSDTKLESAAAAVASIGTNAGAKVTVQVTDSSGKTVNAPFNIVPKSSNVKIKAKDTGTVEIGVDDGATYDLTAEADTDSANLVLTGSNSTTDKVNIRGTGSVAVSKDDTGVLLTGTEYTLDSVSTLAQDKGFRVGVSINNGGSKNDTFLPKIKYGATPQTVDFVKDATDTTGKTGIATLDVYTKGEVDNLFTSADAMVFKGVVSAVTGLPSSAENGWTYKYTGDIITMTDAKKANARIDSSASWINSGDLFIASGTETDGTLTGEWKWVHVPAGDDERYSLVKSSKGTGVGLKVTGGVTDATAGDLVFANDNWITLADASANNTTTVTIGHKLVTASASTDLTISTTETSDQTAASSDNTTLSIPVVTPTVDAAGHVTSLSQTTYKVVDSHNHLDKTNTKLSVTASSGTIKITPKVAMSDGETSTDSNMAFSLKSESLALTAANNVITAELEWDSFDS